MNFGFSQSGKTSLLDIYYAIISKDTVQTTAQIVLSAREYFNKNNEANYPIQEVAQIQDTLIRDILIDEYTLKEPIKAILEIYSDEVVALVPELELFGSGKNIIEAVNELKLELVDLFTDLKDIPDENLGKFPKSWKKIICSLIKHNENTAL